jgi:hypothetical protein
MIILFTLLLIKKNLTKLNNLKNTPLNILLFVTYTQKHQNNLIQAQKNIILSTTNTSFDIDSLHDEIMKGVAAQ